ncbi:RHS repeat-associated core domain protein-containing protein [Pseudomonas sp. GM78]|uniref:RHS repeat-associated core domain-containing protein n=1 Tax=Pseudomonas sp. GM78 TaxID=1144337 RepID=UPI0002705A73|nr:RHS repeat-associated core domain-containing protein [Pseudomonas sp. GM78]EJN18213.1 RHS repeat-associated core domain protein-containing protein [Pseudomonas sp. GM78]
MSNPKQPWLIRYSYDPLDRLTSHARSDTPERHRFYCKNRLATEIQGAIGHSIVQYSDFLLAQQQREQDVHDTTLLATDLQRSVVNTLKKNTERQAIAYSPYGFRLAESGLTSLLGFNGERPDPVTGHYLLGNGYRAFNSALMRFNSPDSLSPFGKGGFNSYAYCNGDPVNFSDPTGHIPKIIRNFLQRAANKKINKEIDDLISKFNDHRRTYKEAIYNKKIQEQIELVKERHPEIFQIKNPDPLESFVRWRAERIKVFDPSRDVINPNIIRNVFLEELKQKNLISSNLFMNKLHERILHTTKRLAYEKNPSPIFKHAKETISKLVKIADQKDSSAIPFNEVIKNAREKIRSS